MSDAANYTRHIHQTLSPLLACLAVLQICGWAAISSWSSGQFVPADDADDHKLQPIISLNAVTHIAVTKDCGNP